MTGDSQNPNLGEGASAYIAGLSPEKRGASQKEVYSFIRWFGRERDFSGLTAAEIDIYAERLSRSDTDYTTKLGLVRGFLMHAKKKGWSKTNLATHLKARKGKTGRRSSSEPTANETISLTQEGYDKLVDEIAALKDARIEVIEETRKAAADKDFRENAPLHAARERRGQIEGRLMELEATFKAAVVIDKTKKTGPKVALGNSVVLRDSDSKAESRYTLVSSNEVDPVNGKISTASPIGKAIIDKLQGDKVEISTPAGKLHYEIKLIEH
ncbi:transcription elongation factor GreA [Chloroflexota bacterium]